MDNNCLPAIVKLFGILPASLFAQESDALQSGEYLDILQ